MAYANLPKDNNQVPLPVLYVHGASWVPLQGSTNTDSDGGNLSTPANFNLVQILSNPASRTNGLPISGDNGTTVVVLPLEALNNLLKASLYGKHTNPGDTALSVDASGNVGVNVISGTVSATNPSVGTDGSTAPTSSTQIGGSDGTNLQPLQVDGSKNLKINVVAGSVTANAGTNLNTSALAVESGGHLANIDTHTPALGNTTMSGSQPVTMASDQTPKTTATATRTNVAGANSDTALLASNTSRKGAIFFNESAAILYLAYGSGAASTSSYTVQIAAGGYFELPNEPIFTGAIRGIWSASTGNVRITELS